MENRIYPRPIETIVTPPPYPRKSFTDPAEAVKADRSSRKAPKVVETDVELEDDALLGESTLAKMAPKKEVVETPATVETPVVDAPAVAPTTTADDAPAESTPASE